VVELTGPANTNQESVMKEPRNLLRAAVVGAVLTVAVALGVPSVNVTVAQPTVAWDAVAQALGKPGQVMPGEVFRVGMPRSDLSVTVEGVPVKAGFVLGSYAAFKQIGEGPVDAMVMGDLVLLDEEVPAVMSGLFDGGLEITAVHNHVNQVTPHVMYVHYLGHGDAVALATALHSALSASGTPLDHTPAATSPTASDQDIAGIEAALGRSGRLMGGDVYQLSIPRAESIMEQGMELLPAMGVATVLNFQPIGNGQSAITGDFVLLGQDVNPVASTLRQNGIEVAALHNHGLGDVPRLFYMHFWGTGDAAQLAGGLRSALDQTNAKAP
jgi:hypothetical protein